MFVRVPFGKVCDTILRMQFFQRVGSTWNVGWGIGMLAACGNGL